MWANQDLEAASDDVGYEPLPGTAARHVQEESGTNIVRHYLQQIGKVPLLKPAQERELCARIEAARVASLAAATPPMLIRPGLLEAIAEDAPDTPDEYSALRIREKLDGLQALKRQLMEANLRLVVSIAKRYQHSSLPLLDLIQEGNLGLIKAVDRFQYRRGFKFSTYATWWIRQAITRAIMDTGRTIRLPAHVVERLNRIGAARRALVRALGRDPTVEEIAAQARIPVDKVMRAIRSDVPIASLDSPIADDASFGEIVADTREVDLPVTYPTGV